MAKDLKSLKESIAKLKQISEEEVEQLGTDAEISGMPEKNEANEDAVTEEDELPSQDEILKKIELATEELDKELDDQKLSDELKESVKKFLKLKEDEIRSDLDNEYADKQKEFEEDMLDKVDNYITDVAEEWLDRNKVALKESIQTKRVRNFVHGLKKLMEENNLELPADAEAEIAKYKDENDDLKDEVNKTVSENYKLRKAVKDLRKSLIVEKKISSLGLALSKADKFRKICEDVDFDGDDNEFGKDIDKEAKALEEEDETGTTVANDVVVDTKDELENDGLSALEEAIKKIRNK